MFKIYKTNKSKLEILSDIENDVWLNLENPNNDEINHITTKIGISKDIFNNVLDKDEISRIEITDNYKVIIINYPYIASTKHKNKYNTMPLGIIIKDNFLVTVTLKNNHIIDAYKNDPNFDTAKRTRFVIDILYNIAKEYLKCLQIINNEISNKEDLILKSTENEDLINLLNIQKSLVYFLTSLKENGIVLDKIAKGNVLDLYMEDKELLEDAIIENNQGIETVNIYREILASTTDTYATIVSNNLNKIMKFLAGITIVFSIPTMIASFIGMNVPLGIIASNDYSFIILVGISIVVSIIIAVILKKKNML